MSDLSRLDFFVTSPHNCSYLPGKRATTLFLDPQQPIDQEIYDRLTLLGFRRSGQHLYRPRCERCNACISARIPVVGFQPSKGQHRILRRNRDLTVIERPARFQAEHYALYARYIRQRHADGDMYPPNEDQYRSFLSIERPYSRLFEFRQKERLVAVAAVDLLSHGLSAIYTFYDAEEKRRSLGSYAILWQIEEAQRRNLPYVYLGYWVQNCRKMSYKSHYKPMELLIHGRWIRVEH